MRRQPKVEKYYKRQAQDLTDMLHDKGFLHPELEMKALRSLQDYIGYLMQTQAKSAIRASQLVSNLEGAIMMGIAPKKEES